MRRSLVTGSSGFIGSHLVEALRSRGEKVRCLVRGTSRREILERLGVEFAEGDVTRPETLAAAVQGVDVVYNLAGLTCALRAEDHRARACQSSRSQELTTVHTFESLFVGASTNSAPGARCNASKDCF